MLSLAGLQSDVRARAQATLDAARRAGLYVEVTSAYRDPRQQQRLYDAWIARGRTGLPAAPPGRSTHEFGLGIDMVVRRGGTQAHLARIAECNGLKWAGARDRVHFDPFGFEAWGAIMDGRPVPRVTYAC